MEIQLSPQGLLTENEAFILKHSDFDSLNAYLRAIRDSPLEQQVSTAYDVLANRDGASFNGIRIQFPMDQDKSQLLTYIGSSRDQYHGLKSICDALISTAPLIPKLCESIRDFSSKASNEYGQLCDDLMALKDNPGDIDRQEAANLILVRSRDLVPRLCSDSQMISDALSRFESDAKAKEVDLLTSLDQIQKRSGPVTHTWQLNENADVHTTHNHGLVTQNLRDEISKLDGLWQQAVRSVEIIKASWNDVASDLGNVEKVLNKPELLSENKIMLNIDRAGIVRKWANVQKEVEVLIGTPDRDRIYGWTSPR